MYSYLAISAPFIIISTYLLVKIWSIETRALISVLILMLALTAIFDSLLVWAGIYDYDATKMLNIIIVKAPIEDFLYAIFAVATTIFIWEKSK